MDKKDIIVLGILFLISFSVWTLPLKDQKYPFGEGDAAHQFGVADWMAISDTTQREYPLFIASWYGHNNPTNYFAPTYAPPYFINLAIFQSIGTDRFLSKGIFLAVISIFLSVSSVYFFTRKLFGFIPGLVAAFFIIFELRLVMSYIFGQRPIIAAIGFIPMVFYCYYKYVLCRQEGKDKPIYLVFLGIFMAISGFMHPILLAFYAVVLGLFTLVLIIKNRKLPFKIGHVLLAILVFGLFFGPFYADYANQKAIGSSDSGFKIQKLDTLFKWFYPGDNPDNAQLFQYAPINGGYWTLPFLIFGMLYLILRRDLKSLLVLSWSVGLYLIIHYQVVGFEIGKIDRVFKSTSVLFFMLMGIGIMGIGSFFKSFVKNKNVRVGVNYFLALFFILMVVFTVAKPVVGTLKETYPPIARMTNTQYDVSLWLMENIPPDSVVYPVGTLTYPKFRWMHLFSHRAFGGVLSNWVEKDEWLNKFDSRKENLKGYTHVLIDYSDFVLLGNQNGVDGLMEFETFIALNSTKLYDKGNIKVYELVE